MGKGPSVRNWGANPPPPPPAGEKYYWSLHRILDRCPTIFRNLVDVGLAVEQQLKDRRVSSLRCYMYQTRRNSTRVLPTNEAKRLKDHGHYHKNFQLKKNKWVYVWWIRQSSGSFYAVRLLVPGGVRRPSPNREGRRDTAGCHHSSSAHEKKCDE